MRDARRPKDGVPTRASKSSMTKSSTARCVGLRNINVNQSQFAEEMLDYAYYKATKGGGLQRSPSAPPFCSCSSVGRAIAF